MAWLDKIRPAVALAFALWAVGFFAVGTPQSSTEPGDSDTVHITSDRLEARQDKRQVVFSGHVTATQGDLTIQGDRMTIFYLERSEVEGAALNERVERIVVEGDVRISKQGRFATGDRAVYYRVDNKVVLTGDPRVQRDQDFIQGERITLFLDRDKSIVEGGPTRPVEATIFSSGPESPLPDNEGEKGGDTAAGKEQGE